MEYTIVIKSEKKGQPRDVDDNRKELRDDAH